MKVIIQILVLLIMTLPSYSTTLNGDSGHGGDPLAYEFVNIGEKIGTSVTGENHAG